MEVKVKVAGHRRFLVSGYHRDPVQQFEALIRAKEASWIPILPKTYDPQPPVACLDCGSTCALAAEPGI